MLGAIIGDTVGSIYEFHNTKEYNFKMFNSMSAYTDDSVMTMAVAYWLLKDKERSYQGLEDIMVMFGEKCPCPMGGYGSGFYRWLFMPHDLYQFDSRYGDAPYESSTGRHPYGSFGNGSAMRVSAVGWFFDTLEETERVAAISAAITHNHPEGIKGAQATAAAIFLARTGKTKEEIRDYIEKTYGYDLHKTWEDWHYMYYWQDSCQGTVPQAMIAFLDSESFEDAIRKAVSLGGDSDTLACITGGIAEAFYKEIPAWMDERVRKPFPPVFDKILDAVRKETVYGSICSVSTDTDSDAGKDLDTASDVNRFLEAHTLFGYEDALEEMRRGRKESHWMWFIFPQLKGLGISANSRYYGIDGRKEAEAFLQQPVLCARLRAVTEAVLSHRDKKIEAIMGGRLDAKKFQSSMTLFDAICPGDVFGEAIDAFFDGKRDEKTLGMLKV